MVEILVIVAPDRRAHDMSWPDTDRMIFAVDVSWTFGELGNAERTFAEAFRPTNEQTCVWVDDDNPSVLRIEFDVEGHDYEHAIEEALRQVRLGASKAGITGHVAQVVAMTENGQARWSA
jgi:hypothetical protein